MAFKREKSKRGGIQDQLNCLESFMRGYGFEYHAQEDEEAICKKSQKYRTSSIRYQYRTNNVQWQINQIELASEEWGLSLVEMFTLGQFLYSYCPSFAGTKNDWIRLKSLGKRVKDLGLHPTKAPDIAKYQEVREKADELRKLADSIGIKVEVIM